MEDLLVLTNLYIDNFKAFNRFKIHFKQYLTVLIGTNAVGKSSVLQAIDLLYYFATNNLDGYLSKHNWKASELKGKSSRSKRNINFSVHFRVDNHELEWSFTLVARKDELICMKERVLETKTNAVLLLKDTKNMRWFDSAKGDFQEFPEIQLKGSMLSLIGSSQEEFVHRFPQLSSLKKNVLSIKSFESLSPEHMRKTSRYDANDLGLGGERLGAFLHTLPNEKKSLINKKLKNYYPYFEAINTKKRQYGHVQLNIGEKLPNISAYNVNANYISDGLLRIIALVSLEALDDDHRILLLDEIEDGINPNLAAELVDNLRRIGKNKQIIVTTHSPVILNYFDKESIVFLWRDREGRVKSQNMFESPKLSEELKFMNAGEIWLNFDPEEIEDALEKTLDDGEDHDD
ncbi:ATP-binding protein [Sporolactobacillus sp. STCC-11]|uniref:AAA family ATPase n=1 Tax=Sporolactobacillus caesalpiniae TaxID=3230362 RepID=UPI0033994010